MNYNCKNCNKSFKPKKFYYRVCPTCHITPVKKPALHINKCQFCRNESNSYYQHLDYICKLCQKVRDDLSTGLCKDVYPDYEILVTYKVEEGGNESSGYGSGYDTPESIEMSTKTIIYDLHKDFKKKHMNYNNKIDMDSTSTWILLDHYYGINDGYRIRHTISDAIVSKKSDRIILDD